MVSRLSPERIVRSIRLRLRADERVSEPHEGLAGWARARFINLGLTALELDELQLHEASTIYPVGWRERGNRIYVAPGVSVPQRFITEFEERSEANNLLLAFASSIDNLAAVSLGRDDATLFIGPQCWLPGTEIHCGSESAVVLRKLVTCTFSGYVDARNGGTVFADEDQLWAAKVYIATDDMHALIDVQNGSRLNGFGRSIEFGKHVWLGRDAAVAGGASIGSNCVVGMRALVRAGTYESGSVLVGAPARAVRTGVTWSRDDRLVTATSQ